MSTPSGSVRVLDTDDGQVLEIGRLSRPVPRRFRVATVTHEANRVRLHSDDGRVLVASLGQLSVVPYLLPAEHNPHYEEQDERAFLDAPNLPAADIEGTVPDVPLSDPVLGEIVVRVPSAMGYTAEVPEAGTFGGRPVGVLFDGVSRARIEELLPVVRDILADLPAVHDAAVGYLWEWGRDDSDTEDDRGRFVAAFGIEAVTVYHSGDFGIDLTDDEGLFEQAFMDGYWPKVHCRADRTPVAVTVEA
ncbi:hypothetical protein [Prescottella agglutinans]|uniref:hypothetical protein n=1 Tax=Prescottella agglutinans TaxID=1644129 RepID=UPI003D974F4D